MEVEVAGVVLARAEGKLFAVAVLIIFFSLQLSGSPIYLLLLWCGASGLLCAYFVFRCLPRAPNLLLNMKHPFRAHSHDQHREEDVSPSVVPCLVCNKMDCKRHSIKRWDHLNPWDDLLVPNGVDSVISEVLEVIMQRYVYSWHRRLAPGSEAVEDELRVTIHHAATILLRRVKKVNFSLLLSRKLLQPAATHIYFYMKARTNLPEDATIASIEAAVLREYGDCIHKAMRGRDSDRCYFRHVAHVLLPLVLPPSMLQSRIVCGLVEELFANKVFLPAMNIVAKPDFINLFLLKIFNKDSRLEPIFGPMSKDVVFLSKWSLARSWRRQEQKSLEIPLPELLDPQHHLFLFIEFMKSMGDIYILQIYLDLNDLKQKVTSVEENVAPIIVEQVERLYQEYLLPTSPNYLKLDHDQVSRIETVLSSECSASSKCEELKKWNVFGRLRGYIYLELLQKIYYPQFLQSTKFYEHYLGSEKQAAEDNTKSKGNRWRLKTKQLKKLSQPSTDGSSADQEAEGEILNGDLEEEEEQDEEVEVESIPKHVQIVDAETNSDGIRRPYTVYCIVVRREEGGIPKTEKVNRRFKEFVCLDEKLRQFHGDIHVQLPSKKTFRNLDQSFVDARSKELEQYLTMLIGSYKIQRSRLLSSFLSPHSDPSLFLPDSVKEKMKKAVPNMLKRDKNQHLEELLQTLISSVEPPSKQANPTTVARATEVYEKIQDDRENYLKNVADGAAQLELDRDADRLKPLKDPVHMESALDLLVFVAVTVYKVSPLQLTSLMLSKLLAQDTAEALFYKFVAGRVDLLSSEGHLIRLVHMLRDAVFFSDGKKRTEEEIMERVRETLERLLNYPNPVIIKVIGEERYRQGTALIIEGLQCMTLNKVLFFKFFDIILLELFPELKEHIDSGQHTV